MKRLRAIGIGLAIAAVSVTPFLIPHHEADAQSSSYYNWDQLGTLDEQYAYAKVYRTADTVITAKKYDSSRSSTNSDEPNATEYVLSTTTGQVVFLLENTTAVDARGNKVDVIFRMKNLKKWSGASNPLAYIYFRTQICGTNVKITSSNMSTLCPNGYNDKQKPLGVGDPIMFWVNAEGANVDFSVEYIKKGSYNNTTTEGTPVPSIDRLSFATLDYDVKGGDDYPSQLFGGDEGISLYSGLNPADTKTTFYYQKTNQDSDFKLKTGNDGIAIGTNNVGNKFNGIYYANSAIGVVSGMENSKYSFRYSAKKAGITVFFGSPIKYDTPAPRKYVVASDKTLCEDGNCEENVATTGDKFNYVIAQDIPDQYSTEVDILTFMSLWSKYPNIARDHFYTSFEISDTLDENLTPSAASTIKIYNDNNEDVTDMFTIALDGSKLTATAKTDVLTTPDFYANTFRIVIPVTVKNTTTKAIVKNTAKTTFKQTGDPDDTDKDSNPVVTNLYHVLNVNHISTVTGKPIIAPSSMEYPHGANYTTEPLTELPEGYKVSKKLPLPANASGTIIKDEVVTYYYDLYYTVTTKHISKQSGAEIADPVKEEYAYKDEYLTEAAKKLPEGYILTEVPKNASGTVDGDIEVIYVYDIPPAPKTLDSDPAPFAFIFTGIGAFITGAVFFLTRRR
ncbi:isopeptide-forming domain-containing fimbrial protein [Candidatus Saccharibacteria bacterium]|nr:isopeptide-forming domain-containing fimbrial protein [Candidatus Saccharibacteria bacterium]